MSHELETKEPEAVPESEAKVAAPETDEEQSEKGESRFLGAEIHIFADEKTGEIRVNAPQNRIIAYGLLEMAKEILAEQAKAARVAQPRIIQAGADALARLRKPS